MFSAPGLEMRIALAASSSSGAARYLEDQVYRYCETRSVGSFETHRPRPFDVGRWRSKRDIDGGKIWYTGRWRRLFRLGGYKEINEGGKATSIKQKRCQLARRTNQFDTNVPPIVRQADTKKGTRR
jgi:hypothetical protein